MSAGDATRPLRVGECVRSICEAGLCAHVGLTVVMEGGGPLLVCRVCGSRWSVVLTQIATGDGYCCEGATNFYGPRGKLLKRV